MGEPSGIQHFKFGRILFHHNLTILSVVAMCKSIIHQLSDNILIEERDIKDIGILPNRY